MISGEPRYTSLGIVHRDFAPFVPSLNEAFERIWTPQDIAQLRNNFKSSRLPIPGIPTEGFAISHRMVPVSDGTDIEIRIYRPTSVHDQSTSSALPLLFVAHGGGWVVGDHDSEGPLCRLVCARNKVIVISVDFRRAPEHPFPTPLNDTYDVYKWTVQHASELGFDPASIVLGGSSAGANLVAALTHKLKNEGGLGGVIGQLLNIPVLCHPRFLPREKHELQSYEQNAQSPTINGERMCWFWDQYLPSANPEPLASPLLAADFKGLPQALIQVAGMDPLRDEGLAYADELKAAGIPVTVCVYEGVPHGFVFATQLKCTQEYFQSMVNWMGHILKTKNA
ncbi:alpha/beta hydrolase fold-domain-containing protein [Aspergillus sergii]|uniref:Alpha/beta hydrolase fold-domain-containing protein n=1 Tax=Aspergillus sergii TaxID=1034303 RepID=A0A5N6XDV5_9EURO|nr:alpha/beta hydrolase fold-domain-containing protein [Aspergillus sergii]